LHHVGAAVVGPFLFAVGGYVRQTFTPATDVSCYQEAEGRWIAVAPLPQPRAALAAAALDGLVYAVGGSGPSGSVATHTVYDHEMDSWRPLAPLPTARNHLAAVALDGFLYVSGGRTDGGGNANSAALDRYDPATDTWKALAPMPTARSGHAAAVIGGRIVVIGGEVDRNDPDGVFDDVEIYDPARDAWDVLDGMDVPRHGIGAVTIGDLVYVPGGATRAGFAATALHDALILF
jgi:N-acetylneuraminic acid mutarotase